MRNSSVNAEDLLTFVACVSRTPQSDVLTLYVTILSARECTLLAPA
jgi:hypothetical protein